MQPNQIDYSTDKYIATAFGGKDSKCQKIKVSKIKKFSQFQNFKVSCGGERQTHRRDSTCPRVPPNRRRATRRSHTDGR